MASEPVVIEWSGKDTPPEEFRKMLDSPSWPLPVAVPASNGAQLDGTLRFTDWRGEVVSADPGDRIEITSAGWVLRRATEEEESHGVG